MGSSAKHLGMSESSSNAILYLVVSIIVLFAAIIGAIVASKLKKKTPELVAEGDVVAAPAKEEETKLSSALGKTRSHFFGRIQTLFQGAIPSFEDIEEILYTSDLGPKTVARLMENINTELSRTDKKDADLVKKALKSEMLDAFKNVEPQADVHGFFSKFNFSKDGPTVWLIVGVNGAGKTTSIGKLASRLAEDGKKVLVAAGDTFRAAAGNQLRVWTERAQVEIFSPEGVTDPSAVAFDAVTMAKSRGYDVVLIDTAGRLHTQSNLMEELKKMKRVVQKVSPEAPHEVLIVLDANSGQNALNQAREFGNALSLTGVVLTKLDGSAKGGVAVGLAYEHKLPIKLIGVGEKIADLRVFSAPEFVDSILG